MYLKLEDRDLGFFFEWDPGTKTLYCLHFASGAKHEQIAAGIETENGAKLAVTMWCRGYRSRMREISRQPGSKHHHLLAETGYIG